MMISRRSEERTRNLHVIFYFLLVIYAFYMIYDIFIGDISRFLWSSFAVLLVALPFMFERYSGMYMPWEIKITIVLGLLLHTIGEVHRFYYILPNYDKISHFISSIAIGLLVFLFLIFIELYYGIEWSTTKVIIFVILLAMAFGLFWEGWEIFSDRYLGSKFFWNQMDGISDVIVDFFGAVYVAFMAGEYFKGRSLDEIAHDFLIRDEKGHYRWRWSVFPIEDSIELPQESEKIYCRVVIHE
jgi:hypothetical protein